MKNYILYIITLIITALLVGTPLGKAQTRTDESELELMNLYNQSQDCLSKGDYNNAIVLKTQIYNRTKNIQDKKILGGLCAFDLAQIYSTVYNDVDNYILWLLRADECELPGASGRIGDAYLTGLDGVPQDFQKAKYYYEKSDDGRCLWIIATMYSPNGELGRNDAEWLKYARKAVDKGDPDAQYILGRCYLDGNIVNKDSNKGTTLIKKAAEQNHIKAIRFLEEQNIH